MSKETQSDRQLLPDRDEQISGLGDTPVWAEEHLQRSSTLFQFSHTLPEKRPGTLRLFYNNCNGIAINNTIGQFLKQKKDKKGVNGYIQDMAIPTKLDGILRQMKNWDVDILSLAELCVAWEDKIPRQIVKQITKQYDTSACWTVASSTVPVGSFCKPGGTGLLVMGNNTGRLADRGQDPWGMGRWSYSLLQGTQDATSILVVAGYRAGQRTSPGGPKTAWAQQQAILQKADRSATPYDAFLLDLTSWLHEYRTAQMELLICLDANEQWGEGTGISQLATEFQLINMNKELDLPESHPNIANLSRSTNIDFCLGSVKLWENVSFGASTPYDLEILGDHRGVLIDIKMDALFRGDTTIDEIKTRNLVTSNPRSMKKYLDLVENKFQKQNLYERCQKLIKRVYQGQTDLTNIMQHYEKIDQEVHGICSTAERKCKPKWAGQYEWSPDLAQAIKRVSYWRYRLQHTEETVVTKKLGKELSIPYVALSRDLIHQQIQKSKQNLQEVQTNARQYRQDHLTELAQQYAKQNKITPQLAITELLAHEDVKSTFKQLRNHMKPVIGGQLAKLWISVDDNGNYVKDTSRKTVKSTGQQIHDALLQRNAVHLQQATATPFAHGNLKHRLKWDGTGKLGREILTGEVLNHQVFNRAMQLYLESIKVQDLTRMNIIRPTLSLEDYYKFWKKKKERQLLHRHLDST